MGDMIRFQNVTTNKNNKFVYVGDSHLSVIFEGCILGDIYVGRSNIQFSNCMFNRATGKVILRGSKALFTNCYFSYIGKTIISCESYNEYTSRYDVNITLNNCVIKFLSDEYEYDENPINVDNSTIITINNSYYYADTDTVTNRILATPIKFNGREFYNTHAGRLNNVCINTISNLDIPKYNLQPGIQSISDGNYGINRTGYKGEVVYIPVVIGDIKRKFITTSNKRTVIFNENGGKIIFFNQYNIKDTIRLYKGIDESNITQYVDIPGIIGNSVLDDGLYCGCYKWQSCTQEEYEDLITNRESYYHVIKCFRVDPNNNENYNVEVSVNDIYSHLKGEFRNGDIIHTNDYSSIIINPKGERINCSSNYDISVINHGSTSSRPNSDTLNSGYQYYDSDLNKPIFFDKYIKSWIESDGVIAGTKRFGITSNRPIFDNNINRGFEYFDTTLNKPIYWTGTKWVDSEGNDADSTPITSGTFDDKPTGVGVGYAYFCTDRQTTEGSTNGIMIYYKGSDTWVDALGRVVS